MADTITVFEQSGERKEIPINARPGPCPRCEARAGCEVFGAIITGTKWEIRRDAIAVCRCSGPNCRSIYTAFYTLVVENSRETARLLQNRPFEYKSHPEFSDAIREISPIFCETYSQACLAEENELAEICGAGFRRALEFLCKDFAIFRLACKDSESVKRIKKSLLSQCINAHLPEAIKEAATRAAWLGNDETHYYRTWSGRDVRDLKALIQLTVKSIDFTLELEHYKALMPRPKP